MQITVQFLNVTAATPAQSADDSNQIKRITARSDECLEQSLFNNLIIHFHFSPPNLCFWEYRGAPDMFKVELGQIQSNISTGCQY